MDRIYLDTAATTKPKKEVVDIMIPYFTDMWHNPSSLYKSSVDVKKEIEKAKKVIARHINANLEEIYFTSGGSESNSLAVQGFVKQCISEGKKPVIITSVIEHNSILKCVKDMNIYMGADVHYIGVNKLGVVNLNDLKNILEFTSYEVNLGVSKLLVSIQYANNEIGTIQNIKDISNLVHDYNGIFHTDAVQAFGHIPINVFGKDIDMMSVSGHKIGCPKGIGFLYKKSNIDIKPLIYGSQMNGLRGGTENVPYIVGLSKAVELLSENINALTIKRINMEFQKDYFINELIKMGCTINGFFNRLPNNISVTFHKNITGEGLLYVLDMSGIQISTGSACNSNSIEPSHVLKAIGLSDEDANRTVRITLPEDITREQIDYVIKEIDKSIKIIEC